MNARNIEVADELVDEASITDGKAIVRFTRTEASLADLRERFDGVRFDLTTVKGDTAARQARRELVSLRTGLDKRRKELKMPAVEFNRKIDSEAQRITAEITVLEEPIDAQIKADESRREVERVARLRAEEERVSAHRARIADIATVAVRAVGMTAAQIQDKIALVTRIVIGADFDEFEAHAVNVKAETLLSLQALHQDAVNAEAVAADNERARVRLAQLEAENAERERAAQLAAQEKARAEAEQRKADDARRAAEQLAAEVRGRQSATANELVDEIRRIQKRAFTSSATGMLELATLVENIRIGGELGDFGGVVDKAKQGALLDLHEMHLHVLTRESEARRVRDEQAEAQRKLDEAAAEVQRREEEVAEQQRAINAAAEAAKPTVQLIAPMPFESVTVSDVSTILEAAKRMDGVDIDAVHATQRPAVVVDNLPDINVTEINRRLSGVTVTAAFIEQKLSIPGERSTANVRATWWQEAQWPAICDALVAHITTARGAA